MIELSRVANNSITILVLVGFFWLIYAGSKDKFAGVLGKVKSIIGKGKDG